MTGKAAKLAEGHLDTHSKKVKFNPKFIANIALECGYQQDVVEKIKTFKLANAIADIIPFAKDEKFYTRILELCYQTCNAKVKKGINFRLILEPIVKLFFLVIINTNFAYGLQKSMWIINNFIFQIHLYLIPV